MATMAFDVNGCLIDKNNKPIEANLELLKTLSKSHKVFVWSGNGWRFAFDWVIRLGISDIVCGVLNKYNTFVPDCVFDDQEINLGRLNICLK